MSTIVPIAIGILVVLIVGGLVFIVVAIFRISGKWLDEEAVMEPPPIFPPGEYDPSKFIELKGESETIGLYDAENGVIHLISDVIDHRTVGAESMEHAEQIYQTFVVEADLEV